MSYVDRFLTYAPLTDTLDVCGGDTVPSYVRVENKHYAPHTKGRFRVYVPEDQLEQLKEKLEEENARLRGVLGSYAKTFESWAAENNGNGRHMDGPDWLELANELRMERDGV